MAKGAVIWQELLANASGPFDKIFSGKAIDG